jgi:two-component system sensor histidine kinase/response regulator
MTDSPPTTLDTVLFVDDEVKARKYFKLIFGGSYRILTAADGQEALEIYLSGRDEIKVVVTDQIMPRMTGLELLGKLRAVEAPAIRILSTAYADGGLVSVSVDDGLIDHLFGMPWNIEKFEDLLKQSVLLSVQRLPQPVGSE